MHHQVVLIGMCRKEDANEVAARCRAIFGEDEAEDESNGEEEDSDGDGEEEEEEHDEDGKEKEAQVEEAGLGIENAGSVA